MSMRALMNRGRALLLALLLLPTLATAGADEAAVESLLTRYYQLIQQEDAKALTALFVPQAEIQVQWAEYPGYPKVEMQLNPQQVEQLFDMKAISDEESREWMQLFKDYKEQSRNHQILSSRVQGETAEAKGEQSVNYSAGDYQGSFKDQDIFELQQRDGKWLIAKLRSLRSFSDR